MILDQVLNVSVYHDERYIEKQWLYHGYLVVERLKAPEFANWLERCRLKASRPEDPVHFVKLTANSNISTQTRLATLWTECMSNGMCDMARYFMLGIDLSKIDRKRFGADAKGVALQTRVYNRFFHMGLFTGLRWFYPNYQVSVEGIYSERRDLHQGDGFLHQAPYHINKRDAKICVLADEVTMVDAKSKDGDRFHVDCLQIADVFTGAISQALDCTSASKKGCTEVAHIIRPRLEKHFQNPYNVNSPWYKRVAISFFPESVPTRQLEQWGTENLGMYHERYIKLGCPGQDEFDLGF